MEDKQILVTENCKEKETKWKLARDEFLSFRGILSLPNWLFSHSSLGKKRKKEIDTVTQVVRLAISLKYIYAHPEEEV